MFHSLEQREEKRREGSGEGDDERQFVHLPLSLPLAFSCRRGESVDHSICPIASGPNLKCVCVCVWRTDEARLSPHEIESTLFNYLFASNGRSGRARLHTRRVSRANVIEGLRNVIVVGRDITSAQLSFGHLLLTFSPQKQRAKRTAARSLNVPIRCLFILSDGREEEE